MLIELICAQSVGFLPDDFGIMLNVSDLLDQLDLCR